MKFGAYAELDEDRLCRSDAMRWKAIEAAARSLEESRPAPCNTGFGFLQRLRQVVLVATARGAGRVCSPNCCAALQIPALSRRG